MRVASASVLALLVAPHLASCAAYGVSHRAISKGEYSYRFSASYGGIYGLREDAVARIEWRARLHCRRDDELA